MSDPSGDPERASGPRDSPPGSAAGARAGTITRFRVRVADFDLEREMARIRSVGLSVRELAPGANSQTVYVNDPGWTQRTGRGRHLECPLPRLGSGPLRMTAAVKPPRAPAATDPGRWPEVDGRSETRGQPGRPSGAGASPARTGTRYSRFWEMILQSPDSVLYHTAAGHRPSPARGGTSCQ